jgi:hypothetical protein
MEKRFDGRPGYDAFPSGGVCRLRPLATKAAALVESSFAQMPISLLSKKKHVPRHLTSGTLTRPTGPCWAGTVRPPYAGSRPNVCSVILLRQHTVPHHGRHPAPGSIVVMRFLILVLAVRVLDAAGDNTYLRADETGPPGAYRRYC